MINTVAGSGAAGFSGDGSPATAASLSSPTGVKVDHYGTIYIADLNNGRVRKVDASGIISTVAGNGGTGFSGDGGPALAATFNGPAQLAIATNGDIFIADAGNFRIRKITSPLSAPSINYVDDWDISVCPNPVLDKAILSIHSAYSKTGRIIVYDMAGKQVLNNSFNSSYRIIDLNNLPSGLYLLEVRTDDGFSKLLKLEKE